MDKPIYTFLAGPDCFYPDFEEVKAQKQALCKQYGLTPLPNEEFPDVIYGAHSPAEYCRLCERALDEDPAWVAPRRRNYGAAAAWSRRAKEVQRILGAIGL